jgi:D-alanyl-D-alanine carboxypeptidase/D-alanyl-D-alanine-endopeptidase (penicillin-binding protein 4)
MADSKPSSTFAFASPIRRLVCALSAWACIGWAAPDGAKQHLITAKKLDTLFAATNFEATGALWSVAVGNVNNGSMIYHFAPNRPMIPASNQKLVTAAAALIGHGPKYRSHTEFYATGPIENGHLRGDLLVVGHGANHFSARYPRELSPQEKNRRLNKQLDQLVGALRVNGIHVIDGKILADASEWTNMPSNAHYPSAWAFSYNENTLDVSVDGNGLIQYVPAAFSGFRVSLGTFAKAQRRRLKVIYINPSQASDDYWRLDGVSTTDYYIDHLLRGFGSRQLLVARRTTIPSQRTLLFRVASLPLESLIFDMNTHSDNQRAETIFLNLGYERHGIANYDTGRRAVQELLAETGLDVSAIHAADGSGLSRENRVNARTIIGIFHLISRSPFADAFNRSLAIAGNSGTLRHRFVQSPLKNNLRAKTGTLDGVAALSGYLTTINGNLISFSFLANQVRNASKAKKTMEHAAELLYDLDLR